MSETEGGGGKMFALECNERNVRPSFLSRKSPSLGKCLAKLKKKDQGGGRGVRMKDIYSYGEKYNRWRKDGVNPFAPQEREREREPNGSNLTSLSSLLSRRALIKVLKQAISNCHPP